MFLGLELQLPPPPVGTGIWWEEGELSGTRSDRWVEEPPGQQPVSDRAGEDKVFRGIYDIRVLLKYFPKILPSEMNTTHSICDILLLHIVCRGVSGGPKSALKGGITNFHRCILNKNL